MRRGKGQQFNKDSELSSRRCKVPTFARTLLMRVVQDTPENIAVLAPDGNCAQGGEDGRSLLLEVSGKCFTHFVLGIGAGSDVLHIAVAGIDAVYVLNRDLVGQNCPVGQQFIIGGLEVLLPNRPPLPPPAGLNLHDGDVEIATGAVSTPTLVDE